MEKILKTLILEDDLADVDLINRTLGRSGILYHPSVVSDKKDFIGAISSGAFDIILSDHSLPQFSSVQALEEVKSRELDVPFILVTGTVSEEFAVEMMQKGVDDYILKSNLIRLPTAIIKAIEKRKIKNEKIIVEKALRESEVRFRALIENNADAIVLRDENFSMIYCSPSAKKILGYGINDPLEKWFDEECHPDDLEKIKKNKKEILENPGLPISMTFRKKHKEGHYIWVDGVMTNMLHDGSVNGIVSNFRDVTEKKKAEQELQNSFLEIKSASERQSAILNSLQSHIALLDENGEIIEVNNAWKNFGDNNSLRSGDYCVNDNYIEIADAASGEEEQAGKAIAKAIRDIISGKKTRFSIEYSCHSTSERYWYRADVTSLYQGRRGGVVIAHTNISESKRAEEALRRNEEQFRRIVETAQEGIWLFDENFKTMFVNEKMCEILNYSAEEMIGKTSFDFMEEQDKASAVHAMGMQKKGINESIELRFKTGAGRHIWTSLSTSAFLDLEGNYEGGLAMVTDVTRRKQIAEELQQSYKDIRELASHLQNIREEERIQIARDIHDELGQQLTGLKMDVSWLNTKIGNTNQAIGEKINGMNELLDEAVKSVRRISANLRPSILDDLGLEAALEWQSQEVQKRFGIQINFNSEFPEIELPVGIATGLFRVYQEALTNAVRHANAHKITSRLTLSGKKIILEINDDGKGIDMAVAGTKKSFGLLGIKERVFVMNGKYEIKSVPGKGTSLSVTVPL